MRSFVYSLREDISINLLIALSLCITVGVYVLLLFSYCVDLFADSYVLSKSDLLCSSTRLSIA